MACPWIVTAPADWPLAFPVQINATMNPPDIKAE
tara:strand:+ start:328 stop:429 length:102 start_codon:yes stop_codon:yes gene_type:complete